MSDETNTMESKTWTSGDARIADAYNKVMDREAEINNVDDPDDDQAFEMKATFEIESIFIHDFLSIENNYIDLLRSKIRGLPKKEAEKILLNDPKVSNVEIQIRPFFINSVSNI